MSNPNTTARAARIAEIEQELAEIDAMHRYDDEQRARFAQMTTAEIWRTVADLEAAAAAGRAVQMERHRAARPAPEPLQPECCEPRACLVGHILGDVPVYAQVAYDAAMPLGQRSSIYVVSATVGELELQADRHGLDLAGERNPNATLTWAEVGALVELHQAGALGELVALARRYTTEEA